MSFLKQEKTEYNMNSKNIGDGNSGEYAQQSNQSSQSSITAFLAKLWALVNDSTCDDLIAWDPSGGSFHVFDQARFAREILPRYFKHNNFASFIRQLNMYGFRKMSTIEHGSLKTEREDIEFAHPYFLRGQESLLEFIKRRAPDSQQKPNTQGGSQSSSTLVSNNDIDSKSNRSIELTHLLEDVRNLKTKQTSLSDKLSYMQNENEALWSEIGSLRQKHAKQQQIVSKLMEFLLHFMTNNALQSHTPSAMQPSPKEVSNNQIIDLGEVNSLDNLDNSQLITNTNNLSPNTLKRKQGALMLVEEPSKRTTMQQQQQQQQLVQPNHFGRQQSLTINELTDSDISGWVQTACTLPLIDLVPSPPPSAQNSDDNYQQPTNDYQWSTTTANELLNPVANEPRNLAQKNKTIPSMAHEISVANTYIPDFVLCPDNTNEKNRTILSAQHGANLTDTKTPLEDSIKTVAVPEVLKSNQIDLPNTYEPSPAGDPKPSPTLNSTLFPQFSHEIKLDPPSEQITFSLDDITGDVDQIQSSLDNIRDLMFDNMPDGTPIEDLFNDENGLLSPLLQSVTDDNPVENTILGNLSDRKLLNDNNNNRGPVDTTINPQSISNVSNQLLEKLITETAKVEEQRNTIEKLEREKSDLTDKLQKLEKQTNKRK